MTVQKPLLIIVNGMPGSGKTTLARRLAQDTGILEFSKDDLKEFIFDQLGVGDREWSIAVGRASSEMLYAFADGMLSSGKDLILENAYYHSFAAPKLREITQRYDVRCLEVYCQLDSDERRRRFVARIESGKRHPGHADTIDYDVSNEEADRKKYAPLSVGQLLTVDTDDFDDEEYNVFLHKIREFIKEGR
jgi:predicted kinase